MGNLNNTTRKLEKLLGTAPTVPDPGQQGMLSDLLPDAERAEYRLFEKSIQGRIDLGTSRPLARLDDTELATLKKWVTRMQHLEQAVLAS